MVYRRQVWRASDLRTPVPRPSWPPQDIRSPDAERRQIMFRHSVAPAGRLVRVPLWLPAALLVATGMTLETAAQGAHAKPTAPNPFKVANIHFETNASACDMGIQIFFDTDGITEGTVRDPKGRLIYD